MEYRQLGRAGVRVSRLCLGTMMFGGATSAADSHEIIAAARDRGVNFIDTADIYAKGESERIVGQAIKQGRDQIVLATKASAKVGDGPNDAGGGRFHLLNALDASLARLDTDYVDIWYLHQPDFATPLEESLRAMDDAVRWGKARYVACSNFPAWRMAEGVGLSRQHGWAPFVAAQPLYNIVNRDIERELLPACAAMGVGVVSYSPLARGVLTGKYESVGALPADSRAARKDPRLLQTEFRAENIAAAAALRPLAQRAGVPLSQWAIAWALANSRITSVILGPRTMEQWLDNSAALNFAISADDETAVDAIVPPGEHTQFGYVDPAYPITGRPRF